VARGRVLIVEADEWVTTLVRKFLVDAGYETDVAMSARAGFDRAVATLPDLVLCDVTLPDIDGFWVTRRIRSERGRLATTPVLLISQSEDHAARLEGLAVGADVFLTAPFRYDEIIAQVDALVGMAKRLRARRDSSHAEHAGPPSDSAIRGDIAQISIPTMLTMLEMERRTGRLRIRSDGAPGLVIELVDGAIVGSIVDREQKDPVSVVIQAIALSNGKYSFEPDRVEAAGRPRHMASSLLLEAARRHDESRRF
jgi:two-component system, OmpR family, response regulator